LPACWWPGRWSATPRWHAYRAAERRLGSTKYLDIWLVDKSGRFQLDTLTEGQR
jgi:hypothetical protein